MESTGQNPHIETEPVPKYDAVVVLGRGIGRDPSGRWKPVSYFVESSLHSGVVSNKVDPNSETSLVGGGNANTLALFHFYRQLSEEGSPPKLVIFAAGRPDYLAKEDSDLSEGSVMRDKFLHKLKVEGDTQQPETVILDKNKNTRDDMVESLKMIQERGLQNVVVITVGVQIERAQEFLKLAREKAGISEEDVHIDFKAAEDVLMGVSKKYKRRFENVSVIQPNERTPQHTGYQQTAAYKKTKEMEERGTDRLKAGTYFTTGPYKSDGDKST